MICCPRYILRFATNTRSARERPIKLGESPSQPSDFVQRSEAKLYRGGRPAALDTPSTSFQALGQRVNAQANRVILCNAVKQNCIEVGDLLTSIHFGFSINYIPYVISCQNTRSAREFPSQPSDFVQRSEAKLYRGGLLGGLYRGEHIVHIKINYYLQVA